MKKILSIFGFTLLFASCAETPENSYSLEIDAEGIADSTQVFVQKLSPASQGVIVDTLLVMNGKASTTGIATEPGFHALIVEDIRGGFPFFIEEGTIEVTAYKDSINKSKVSGTPNNDTFSEYKEGADKLQKRFMSIQKQMSEAQSKGDTVSMNVMRETFTELQQDGLNMDHKFIEEHPSSMISVILLNNMLRQQTKPADSVSSLFDKLDPQVKNSDFGKNLTETFEKLNKVKVGATAPAFKAPTPEGTEMALSEALGKVTIVDFWASWCKPCRAENPSMVKLYNQYHEKGLNVIGVSLDQKKEAWIEAIEQDGLPWYQVSHVQGGNDPIAREYQVNSIPATFVLDENGVIIAKGLRGEALYEKIAELLP